jgi:hypothetical protein
MKFFEKTSEYKTWDENFSFTENIAGGSAIGAALGAFGAKTQTSIIKKKLKAIEEIKKIRPNTLRLGIIGALIGSAMGAGKHFYEQEKYTK